MTPPERNTAPSVPLYVEVATLSALVFWLVWAMGQLRDSDAFRAAVSAWARVLRHDLDTPRDWRRFQNLARFLAMRLRVERGEAGIGFSLGLRKLKAGLAAWAQRQPNPVDRTEQDEGLIVGLLALRVRAQGADWSAFQALASELLDGEDLSDLLDALEGDRAESGAGSLSSVLRRIPPVNALQTDVFSEAQKAGLAALVRLTPEGDTPLRAFLEKVKDLRHGDLPRLPPALAEALLASPPTDLDDTDRANLEALLKAGSDTARQVLELASTGVFESAPVVNGALRSGLGAPPPTTSGSPLMRI